MINEATQLSVLKSIADIYYSMHLINLQDNTFTVFSAHNQVKDMVEDDTDAPGKMASVISVTIKEEHVDEALTFTDLTTIADRMTDTNVLSKEFHGNNIGWIEASFIVVDRDQDGKPHNVIFTTRCIDENKKNEELLINRSNTDELTGFLNRRAYEDNIKEYNDTASEEDFVYISMDVNGLKVVNDTLGHAAGDELLKGAADCMRRCIGPYGRLFRTGGDEFAAIIFATEDTLEEIKNDFNEAILSWSGNLVDSVSVACGYVARRDTDERSVRKIALLAEEKMYQEKTRYYQKKGVDRRGQKDAHTALCDLYTKILKINLTDDSYQIVNMDLEEQKLDKSISGSIITWLHDFGLSGHVHKDDLEDYLKFTDKDFILNYFESDKTSLHVFYRRKYGDVFKLVMMELIPAKDYSEDNKSFYLYVRDIDR